MEDRYKAVQGSEIPSPNCVSSLGGNDGISTVKGEWESCFPSLLTERPYLGFAQGAIVPASQDWTDTFSGLPCSFTTL